MMRHPMPNLDSAIYEGYLRHRRHRPRPHRFTYPVYMLYLRLDKLPQVWAQSRLCSPHPLAPIRFVRSDYFGPPNQPLDQAVRQTVAKTLGTAPSGPICMLTNLRHFGHRSNPLTVYYCFDEHRRLHALLLEVTNAPWGERHHYVLATEPHQRTLRTEFAKELHVSPFNPMNMRYRWHSTTPGRRLVIHMQTHLTTTEPSKPDPPTRGVPPLEAPLTRGVWGVGCGEVGCGRPVFDASLVLRRHALTPRNLRRTYCRYPFMTWRVSSAIYWQAFKLFLKKPPLHPKPPPPNPNPE